MRLHFQNLYILGPTPRPTVTKKSKFNTFCSVSKKLFLKTDEFDKYGIV